MRNRTNKKAAPPQSKDRLYASTIHSPEELVTIFGNSIKEIVEHNLQLACGQWLEKHKWIETVESIIKRYPDDGTSINLAGLYKAILPGAKRELWQCQRHIRHLQKCFDLLHRTKVFSPKYSQERQVNVETLKERLNIVDVIGQEIELRQTGRIYKGKCCFHNDNTPSLIVYPDTASWWCFACSEGGDAITFIQKLHNCDFKQALSELQKL